MSTHPNPRATYAPPAHADPVQRLASTTLTAVSQIGTNCANEIEKEAAQVMRGAEEVRDGLLQLAEAIREHTKIAHEKVSAFNDECNEVLKRIRGDDEGLKTSPQEEEQVSEERGPVPEFIRLTNGNGVSHD